MMTSRTTINTHWADEVASSKIFSNIVSSKLLGKNTLTIFYYSIISMVDKEKGVSIHLRMNTPLQQTCLKV
jgi:hypothetical protein